MPASSRVSCSSSAAASASSSRRCTPSRRPASVAASSSSRWTSSSIASAVASLYGLPPSRSRRSRRRRRWPPSRGARLTGPEPRAHAPAGDHLPRQVGRLLHVVLGAGGARSEDQLLGHAAAHRADDARVQVLLAVAVPIVLRSLVGDAQRHAVRHDRHPVDRVGARQRASPRMRVPALVVGDARALLDAHHQRPRRTEHQRLERVQEVLLVHGSRPVAPRRQQRGLVDQVAQVGADQARRRRRRPPSGRRPRRAARRACGPSESSRGRACRAAGRSPVDRTGPAAAAPGRARPGGWSPPAR